MNKETIQGKFDQTAGAVKQKVGEAVGNQKLANAGVADQIKGAAKETWGKTKDVAAKQGNAEKESLTQRMEEAAHNMRERLAESAENAKNRVNEKLDETRDRNEKA